MPISSGAKWRRVSGFRVVVSWPQDGYAPPPRHPIGVRAHLAGFISFLLLAGGALAVIAAFAAQQHAPRPAPAAAGAIRPAAGGRSLSRSLPVSVAIPAIGVDSTLLYLGVNPDGTMQVPPLPGGAGEAGWYKYSVTPGEIGAAVIEGHVDSYQGPAVFFRLGDLHPGDAIDVRLADGVTAIFRVTGVRMYTKPEYPATAIYSAAGYAGLRLITCGGDFDYATGHYLSSVVVFASLASARSR